MKLNRLIGLHISKSKNIQKKQCYVKSSKLNLTVEPQMHFEDIGTLKGENETERLRGLFLPQLRSKRVENGPNFPKKPK